MTKRNFAVGGAAAILAVSGFALAGSDVSPLSVVNTTTETIQLAAPLEPNCELGSGISPDACGAAGVIRFVSLHNLQGAAQFCKWRAANPGEWNRLKGYAATATPPSSIVTWFGNHIRNDLEAYFATGSPAFTVQPNTAPNVCRTPLSPPVVSKVTPGETDATVTVTTTP